MGADALDLRDHESVGVLRRRRKRQVVQRQRLALHRDVAAQVGGRAANQRHRHREGLVEQPVLAVDRQEPDQVLPRAVVDLATGLARVDEGAHADLGQRSGTVTGNVAKELGQRSERKVVGLDLAFDRHAGELRHQSPVPADGAFDETDMRETVQSLVLAVARRGREQQGQVLRLPGRKEALLQCTDQRIGRTAADEPGNRNGIAVANDRHCVCGADNLVPHVSPAGPPQGTDPPPRGAASEASVGAVSS